jgi:hypothetical protein
MTYSRQHPTLNALVPWFTLWEEDAPLREMLMGFKETTEWNKNSSLKAEIIRADLQRVDL